MAYKTPSMNKNRPNPMINSFMKIYSVFGFIGIYGLNKISFFKKHFQKKQNAIYLTIYYIVFGFFIGQKDPLNSGIAFQIGYGFGNCFAAVLGAVISSYFANKNKFLMNIQDNSSHFKFDG